MSLLFRNVISLTDITGLSNWDTAKVASFSYMFEGTAIIDTNALASGKNNNPNIWNTGNVTDMSYMFSGCTSLTDIAGLSYWDTARVINMKYMFTSTKITTLDSLITNKNDNSNIWNTGNVTSMSDMFASCSLLTDISGMADWDTMKLTDMHGMFSGSKITNLDALEPGKNNNPNIWNTGNVTDMWSTFSSCSSLTDITGIANWDTARVTTMRSIFSGTNIANVDALSSGKNGNPNIWNTGNVTSMIGAFKDCLSLTNITGLSNWDTANVTNIDSMFAFTKITNLDALASGKNNNPNIWNTGNVTGMNDVFNNCSSLTDITGLSNWNTIKVTSMYEMFQSTKITDLDALASGKNNNPNIWNTGNVTNMSYMFSDCASLTDITGLSYWDTAKVTSISYMFRRTKITNLYALAAGKNNNPNIWNTGSIQTMNSTFEDCSSLTDIVGLSNWYTVKLVNVNTMFKNTAITTLDALTTGKNDDPNIWNTGGIKYMHSMFSDCSSLTDITGISNWDTAQVISMYYMFASTKITNLDALEPYKGNNPNIWNTGNVTNMIYMFSGITTLSNISKIANWDVNKVTATADNATFNANKFYYMFYGVPSTTTSGFSFTNRAGSLDSNGTYVVSN